MGQQVFVPLTDDLIYEHPERIPGPILPYSAGRPCHHWLSVEILEETDSDSASAPKNN